jgi:type IV pilus assembly protein PilE
MFLHKGVTLIEMLIVIAIIGVLASIASPMYTKHVNDGRRSEATSALENLASVQARFYSNNDTYTNLMVNLGPVQTTNNLYTLAVPLPVPDLQTTYVLSATPTWADPDCGIFYLDNVGRRWVSNDYDGDGVGVGGGPALPAVIDADDVAACWR